MVSRTVSEQSPHAEVARAFVEQSRKFLRDDYLPKIEHCLESLSDVQVWWRANEESNSIGNLLLHLSGNARQWIVSGLGGTRDQRDRDWEFAERDGLTRTELLKRLRDTLSEVDSVLANLDLAQLLEVRKIQGTNVTTLEAIFHVTEHFSMHTGQIIYISKLLTGKDLHFYDFKDRVPSRQR